LFKSVKHGDQEHDVLIWDELQVDARAQFTKAICSGGPGAHIIRVGDGKGFLDELNLSDRALLLMACKKFVPHDAGIHHSGQAWKF